MTTKTIVIYAIGAPTVPDNGQLPDSEIILGHGCDLFVPDYIGFGRSDGVFTPKNCIKTLLYLFNSLKGGCTGVDYYTNTQKKLKYPGILFIGRSLGGSYVSLLPSYNPEINKLCLLYPAVDQSEQGKMPPEESNDDFMRAMKSGYKHLYRGVLAGKLWWDHINDRDGLSPMDNIHSLQEVKMFIGHGKQDTCINYHKSEIYHKSILDAFPTSSHNFKLKLYPQGDHGPSTSNKAVNDFLSWILVK